MIQPERGGVFGFLFDDLGNRKIFIWQLIKANYHASDTG
jgi:hypothetical protein